MSGSQKDLWSDNPNAPRISHSLYIAEKANFAGVSLGIASYGIPTIIRPAPPPLTSSVRSIIPGIVVILFFQCMSALLNPVDSTRGGIKWSLVAYTVIMFSIVTLSTAMGLDLQSVSYISNREFPGVEGELPPGPAGYQNLLILEAISIIPSITFFLNNWLADGFLVNYVKPTFLICLT